MAMILLGVIALAFSPAHAQVGEIYRDGDVCYTVPEVCTDAFDVADYSEYYQEENFSRQYLNGDNTIYDSGNTISWTVQGLHWRTPVNSSGDYYYLNFADSQTQDAWMQTTTKIKDIANVRFWARVSNHSSQNSHATVCVVEYSKDGDNWVEVPYQAGTGYCTVLSPTGGNQQFRAKFRYLKDGYIRIRIPQHEQNETVMIRLVTIYTSKTARTPQAATCPEPDCTNCFSVTF